VDAVNVEVQVADAVVEVPRVQVVNDPVTPVSDKVTVPVGVTKVPASLSVTVTVQVEPTLMSTGVVQLTVVVVVLLFTVMLVVPLLAR
jgi:hypothetical protein